MAKLAGLTWVWAVTGKIKVDSIWWCRGQEAHVIHCSDPAGNVDEKLECFLATTFGGKLRSKCSKRLASLEVQ